MGLRLTESCTRSPLDEALEFGCWVLLRPWPGQSPSPGPLAALLPYSLSPHGAAWLQTAETVAACHVGAVLHKDPGRQCGSRASGGRGWWLPALQRDQGWQCFPEQNSTALALQGPQGTEVGGCVNLPCCASRGAAPTQPFPCWVGWDAVGGPCFGGEWVQPRGDTGRR